MEIDKDKQTQALAKAKSIISDAEKKREAARVEKGVQKLMLGDFEALYNDELVENLASYMLNKYILDEPQEAIEILEKLGEGLHSRKADIRERSLMVLSVFSEIIIEEKFQEFQQNLSTILIEWLRVEDELIAGYELVCSQLQKIILEILYNEQWSDAVGHLEVIHKITTGAIAKSALIQGISAKVHENLADPDILDKLVTAYLDETDDRHDVIEQLLIQFGRYSALFLVQKMIYSNNKEDRFALIDLIPRVGEVSIPVLVECLEDQPQWFVVRNIIFIISRLEDSGLYSMAESYLTHSDIRVQQQVINCIEMLGGTHLRKRLITALVRVNDDLKGQIINQLVHFSDEDVGEAFLSLLENRKDLARHVHDDLVLKLCIRIKCYPSAGAIACLKDLLEEREHRYGAKDRIITEASASLRELEKKVDVEIPDRHQDETDTDSDRTLGPGAVENFESEGASLFSNDEMDDFAAGADVGETLIDSIPQEGVDLAETDDEENPSCISREQHMMIWSKLYEEMNGEAAVAFFELLEPASYKTDDEIVNRGDKVTTMFFIDSGFAGLTYHGREGEILLTGLQAGDLIGSQGFVQGVEWTISLTAQTDLQVRVLEQDSFAQLTEQFPDLSQTLQYYYNHYDVIPYLLSLTEDEDIEPLHEEITVDGISFLHDSSGVKAEDSVIGSLQYIACGGYCLTLPFVHQDNAEELLGRQVSSEITLQDGFEKRCFGVIAGAGSHFQDDQAIFVYVKFYHPLNKAEYSCSVLTIM